MGASAIGPDLLLKSSEQPGWEVRPSRAPDWAWSAARACGVTRLADITHLDTLGVPVFQAVRPWGKALSVHQGKGLTPEAARIGALMEAVESHQAEVFDAPCRTVPFLELPESERAAAASDFACADDFAPADDEPIGWTPAKGLHTGAILWVPFDSVSLDYTRVAEECLDRSSNGLGAGRTMAFAAVAALLEVIERDAFAVWARKPPAARTGDRVSVGSIPFDWFARLIERIDAAGLKLSIFRLATLTELPAFLCEIRETVGLGCVRSWIGAACRLSAEGALVSCVTEAAQCRLTMISGVRDDLEPECWSAGFQGTDQLASPMPGHLRALSWCDIVDCQDRAEPRNVRDLARELERAGYPLASFIDLSPPDAKVSVAKVFVPGLAAFGRGRRTAGH